MRTTRTFILRLLIDSDDPTALRAVDTSKEHTFADVERLLALLRAGAAPDEQEAATEPQPTASTIINQEERP